MLQEDHSSEAGGAQGWEQTETADTLNVFDLCESRVPVIVVEGDDDNGYECDQKEGAQPLRP